MSEISRVWRIIEEWRDLVPFAPSQSRIAERVGVSRSAVSDWKSGKTRPTPENLTALAEMMEPQLGPDVHIRLTVAVMRDMGYFVSKRDEDGVSFSPGVNVIEDILRRVEARGGDVRAVSAEEVAAALAQRSRAQFELIAHEEEHSIESEQGHDETP